jgi:hypothetical protein
MPRFKLKDPPAHLTDWTPGFTSNPDPDKWVQVEDTPEADDEAVEVPAETTPDPEDAE